MTATRAAPSWEELEAEGLTRFEVFLEHLWRHLKLPAPDRIQRSMARALQFGPDKLIVMAPRGMGKSYITAGLVVWLWLMDPQLRVLVVSATEAHAEKISFFIKSIVESMPLVQHLAPQRDGRRSVLEWDNGLATPEISPSLKAAGISGQITGSRADIIIPDDIEIPENSLTALKRERISEKVKEFQNVMKAIPEERERYTGGTLKKGQYLGGRVVYLGTPQTEETLYRKLEERGYVAIVWTAEVPEDPSRYGTRLAPIIRKMIEARVPAGTPTEPYRFNERVLAEKRLENGPAGYALQYMLDPTLADADERPLRLLDLIVHDVDHERAPVKLLWDRTKRIEDLGSPGLNGDGFVRASWTSPDTAPYTRIVMAIDPSGRGKDETSYAIAAGLHGQVFLLDVGGFMDGFGEETLRGLALKALRFKVNEVRMEKTYGGGMFGALFRPVLFGLHPCAVEEFGSGVTFKEKRILEALEPLVQQHRLIVDRACIERDLREAETGKDRYKYSWLYQFTRLTRERGSLTHDDRLEAIAEACRPFADIVSVDRDSSIKQQEREQREREIAEFLERCGLGSGDSGFQTRYNFGEKVL